MQHKEEQKNNLRRQRNLILLSMTAHELSAICAPHPKLLNKHIFFTYIYLVIWRLQCICTPYNKIEEENQYKENNNQRNKKYKLILFLKAYF